MNNRLLLFLLALLGMLSMTACKTSKKAQQKRYMKHAYKNIKKNLKEAQVTRLTDTVKVIFPTNLLFPFNSANINPDVMPSMQRFSKALNKFAKTAVMISGYTDSIGTTDYNNTLSGQRADTAKKVLTMYNVSNKRLNTWGMGSRHPIAPNNTEPGRARNRRVEFIILYAPED